MAAKIDVSLYHDWKLGLESCRCEQRSLIISGDATARDEFDVQLINKIDSNDPDQSQRFAFAAACADLEHLWMRMLTIVDR